MKNLIFDKLVVGIVKCCPVIILATITVGATGYTPSWMGRSGCEKFRNDLQTAVSPKNSNLKDQCLSDEPGTNTYKAEFTISPKDLETLQQYVRRYRVDYWYSTPPTNDVDAAWVRKSEGMKSLLYAEYVGSDYMLKVMIDTSQADQYVVYYKEAGISQAGSVKVEVAAREE